MRKSTVITFMAALIAMFIIVPLAEAGILDTIKGAIAEDALKMAASALLGGIGVFSVFVRRWNKAAMEAVDVLLAVKKAVGEKSEGGKQITKAEMDNIIQEATQMGSAIATAYASRKNG